MNCVICKRPIDAKDVQATVSTQEFSGTAHFSCVAELDDAYAVDCHAVAADLASRQRRSAQ